jgi:TetR/AcrR family transcriptional regulator, cholesterol catabolism regulator
MPSNPKPRQAEHSSERSRVYEVAAEVFHRKGYDNTSMSDVADAVGLTKAGLYHYIASKERLLFTVLDYGLDLTEAHVVEPLRQIKDPVQRLCKMIELHLHVVLEQRNVQVTGLLHECRQLSSADRARINRRKKAYVEMTVELIREILDQYEIRSVDPKLAAFALLGMLNWTYQWYKPAGRAGPDEIVKAFRDIFLHGIGVPVPRRRKNG